MSIHVHHAELFEKVRQCAAQEAAARHDRERARSPLCASAQQSLSRSPGSMLGTPDAAELLRITQHKRAVKKHELYQKEQEALQKKLTEGIADAIQKQKMRKEAQYTKLWKEVESAKTLSGELCGKVDLQEQARDRQFQRMHEEWSSSVYHKLNDPIVSQIDGMDSRELCERRHQAYERFLSATNKKGGLFRDIIIESDYDPLHDIPSIAHHAPVDDPVKRTIRRREEEDALASDSSLPAHPTQQLGRNDNLDVKLWSQGVFESTPHGHFHKMLASRPTAQALNTSASHIKLDHYNIDIGDRVVQQELPRGKRTVFPDCKVPTSTLEIT